MKKIINHPQLTLDILLKKFFKNKTIKFYLIILKFAFNNDIPENKKIIDAWEIVDKTIISGKELDYFCNLLINIWIDGGFYIKNYNNINNETDKELIDLWNQHIEFRNKIEKNVDKYSWFENSLVIGDLLSSLYDDTDNPGIIIGRYINKLYNKNIILEDNQFILSDKYFCNPGKKFEVIENSELHILLFKIGMFLIELQCKDNKYLKEAITCIFFPKKYNKDFNTINNIILNLYRAPRGLILSWVYNFWIYNQFEENYNLVSNEIIISLFKVFPIGYKNFIDINFYYQYYHHHDIVNNKLSLPFSFDYTFLRDVCRLIQNSDFTINDELKIIFKNIFENFTLDRILLNNGISFLDEFNSQDLSKFYLNDLGFDLNTIDIVLFLSEGLMDCGYLFLFLEKTDFINNKKFYYDSNKNYVMLFNRFTEFGYDELANSLYSLYLLILTYITNGELISLSEIIPTIKKGLLIDGSSILKKTILIIDKLITDKLNKSNTNNNDILFLNKYTFSSITKSFENLLQSRSSDEAGVENKYINNIGIERWNKLYDDSRKYIIDSEFLWVNNSSFYGLGMYDCSGLISGYCKCVEKEIVDRYSSLYSDVDFLKYCANNSIKVDAKLTIGTVLYAIRRYNIMPENIKLIMDRIPFKLHRNQNLVKKISNLIHQRNQASHKEHFDMIQYATFKKLFIGYLSEIIDCIE